LVIIKLTTGLFKNAFSNALGDKGESLCWNEVMRKRDGMIGGLKNPLFLSSVSHANITVLETPW
jgi:hypothetical protein